MSKTNTTEVVPQAEMYLAELGTFVSSVQKAALPDYAGGGWAQGGLACGRERGWPYVRMGGAPLHTLAHALASPSPPPIFYLPFFQHDLPFFYPFPFVYHLCTNFFPVFFRFFIYLLFIIFA